MDMYTLSDDAILSELGARFKALRLSRNITQQQLAEMTTLSVNVIQALEDGRAKLSTAIAVLREMNALDALDSFIPPVTISPIQLVKMQGKQRQRASGERVKDKPEDSEW